MMIERGGIISKNKALGTTHSRRAPSDSLSSDPARRFSGITADQRCLRIANPRRISVTQSAELRVGSIGVGSAFSLGSWIVPLRPEGGF